ncbi:MAG TPA: hypothetical protein VLX92_34235 [Kofleriaceae bacterium]|nr:hypothetical protein [Kofleriaceae bacterium]
MSWARWATCALAISICVPALAGGHTRKSLADCTRFDQNDKGDDAIELSLHNSCSIPVDCSISWRVVCAPSSKRRSEHPGSQKLSITEGTTQSAEASAAPCGDDAWSIDNIAWSCQPNNE